MSRSRADACGYRSCSKPAIYIIEQDGRRMAICRDHYRLLIRRLQERAERNETAELQPSDLSKDGLQ